jgi:hypothetical protein
MNIFQPPTDSLYKFMAVSGLLILGFSLIWPELRLYELEKQTVELEGENRVLKVEIDNLNNDRDIKAEARVLTILEKRRIERGTHE